MVRDLDSCPFLIITVINDSIANTVEHMLCGSQLSWHFACIDLLNVLNSPMRKAIYNCQLIVD